MGMYSTFISQNIRYNTPDATLKLSEISQKLKNEDLIYIARDLISYSGTLNFINWSEHKLYGYLGEESSVIKLLKLIAPFISGEAVFLYEEGFKFKFVFKDSKVFLATEKEVIYNEEEL